MNTSCKSQDIADKTTLYMHPLSARLPSLVSPPAEIVMGHASRTGMALKVHKAQQITEYSDSTSLDLFCRLALSRAMQLHGSWCDNIININSSILTLRREL
jgi:hypothetical protein